MSNFFTWQLERAAAMFPLMPKDVFDIFLKPLILTDMGWPYSSIFDALRPEAPWYCVFHPFSLAEMAKMRWGLCDVVIDENALVHQCLVDLDLVWQNYNGLLPRDTSYDYDDCRKRTQWHLDYIKSHGMVCPTPIVAAESGGKLKLFDGNHRIVAAWHSGMKKSVFKLWKGVV